MPRPKRCRCVSSLPGASLFKPAGIPACSLGEVVLAVDEFEALRLADYAALYQEQAAERMGVSGRRSAGLSRRREKKVVQALVEGLVLRIEGGKIEMAKMRAFQCGDCGHVWEVPLEPAAQPDVRRASARLSTVLWRPRSANQARRTDRRPDDAGAAAVVGGSATARAAAARPTRSENRGGRGSFQVENKETSG